MNFFTELKRRNVYKVAVAYAIVGWLLVQVATQVFPFLEIPTWVVRLVIVLVAAGFPIALVIAWAFELTPEGIKRTEDVDLAASARQPRKYTWIFVVIVGAALSVGLFFIGRYTARNTPAPRPVTQPEARPGVQSKAVTAIPPKSIAVLPFENLSSDKENAYFAEGIQDEILTRLSKIAALRVISRSSTQKYNSAPDNLREVGKQLGVANLLEGSVQKIANAVHINVQLIHAATDEHVWAESYNRKFDDVFGVEGEVASAIADQLNAKLTGAEQEAIADKPTQNTAAYDAYLRGLAFAHRTDELDLNITKSIAAFEEVVRLDPRFGAAWAWLSQQRAYAYLRGDHAPTRRKRRVPPWKPPSDWRLTPPKP